MRLAFDVRDEWEHLIAQLSWRRMARLRLGMETLRWWRAVRRAPGEVLCFPGLFQNARVIVRRTMWVLPRVSLRVTSGVGGTLLLCAFLAVGIRIWGSESGEAKAGVMGPASVRVPSVHDVKIAEPVPQAPASGELARPGNEVTIPRAVLARAREKCLERLMGTEAYGRAKAEYDRLDEKVRALRSDDPFRELPRVSVEWIQAKSEVKRLVDEAERDDLDLQEALEAVKAAGARKG